MKTKEQLAAEHHTVMTVIGKPKPGPKAKKAKNPPIDKVSIINERYPRDLTIRCECGCGAVGHDLHHAFIGRRKGYPVLDDAKNLVLVNHWEHIGRKFEDRYWRKFFWKKQCALYGESAMMEWVNSLPEKMRDRIDWL